MRLDKTQAPFLRFLSKRTASYIHLQEDRNIQHSLHINNVQELIEKEKVADYIHL